MVEVIIAISFFAIGLGVAGLIFRLSTIGVLRVDSSDPYDGPHLFLELSKGPETIKKKDYVVLRVDTRNYNSLK